MHEPLMAFVSGGVGAGARLAGQRLFAWSSRRAGGGVPGAQPTTATPLYARPPLRAAPPPPLSRRITTTRAVATERERSDTLLLPTNESSEHLLRMRHTSAHVMAMAVQRVFPKTHVTIGPCIDNGFYYDFEAEGAFTEDDLKLIKKEMDRIIRADLPLVCEEVSREEAQRRIHEIGEPYKLEILDAIRGEPITIYHIGNEWWDLCAGPHVSRTGELRAKAIELESVAGAYWRGDERRPALQRIYGTCWETPEQLKEYKRLKQEAKRRDHRVLGQKLGLFSIQDKAGGGLVFWHPKGSVVRRIIEDFWREKHLEGGYELIYTPHIANSNLWKTSGHLDFYRESMFDQMQVENEEYQIRPMNCPFHILIFKSELRSYRDLPVRWAELGTVYRYERSGTLHGLFRVRGFTQDDAHIFCLPEQLEDEIVGVLELVEIVLGRFGFTSFETMLSTRPDKSVGSEEIWERATSSLRNALERKGWSYGVDEGGGAFYGPKIDIKIRDAIGRLWQCSTVQCDFNLPERFDMEYVDSDGRRKRPIMVHRALLGSIERFIGVLTESYAGDFPLWLAPVQLRLLPVTDAALEYCRATCELLKRRGVRAEVDSSGERLAKMVRGGEQQRVPLLAVAGAQELESGRLSVRQRGRGDVGAFDVGAVADAIADAVRTGGEFALEPQNSSE